MTTPSKPVRPRGHGSPSVAFGYKLRGSHPKRQRKLPAKLATESVVVEGMPWVNPSPLKKVAEPTQPAATAAAVATGPPQLPAAPAAQGPVPTVPPQQPTAAAPTSAAAARLGPSQQIAAPAAQPPAPTAPAQLPAASAPAPKSPARAQPPADGTLPPADGAAPTNEVQVRPKRRRSRWGTPKHGPKRSRKAFREKKIIGGLARASRRRRKMRREFSYTEPQKQSPRADDVVVERPKKQSPRAEEAGVDRPKKEEGLAPAAPKNQVPAAGAGDGDDPHNLNVIRALRADLERAERRIQELVQKLGDAECQARGFKEISQRQMNFGKLLENNNSRFDRLELGIRFLSDKLARIKPAETVVQLNPSPQERSVAGTIPQEKKPERKRDVGEIVKAIRKAGRPIKGTWRRFHQTQKKCRGAVKNNEHTQNIDLCFNAIASSFGINNTRTKVIIRDKGGNMVGRAFERFARSDHGPYLEMREEDVYWEELKLRDPRGNRPYYLDWRTGGDLRVYHQVRTVQDRPYPPRYPKGRGNVAQPGGREGGYADYRPGYCYVDARKVTINGKRFRWPWEQGKGSQKMQVDDAASSTADPPNGGNAAPGGADAKNQQQGAIAPNNSQTLQSTAPAAPNGGRAVMQGGQHMGQAATQQFVVGPQHCGNLQPLQFAPGTMYQADQFGNLLPVNHYALPTGDFRPVSGDWRGGAGIVNHPSSPYMDPQRRAAAEKLGLLQ